MVYNWSVDLKELKKNKEAYTIWKLEQMINYGLDGERLDRKLLKKYWRRLYIDPDTRRVLAMMLWQKKSKKTKRV